MGALKTKKVGDNIKFKHRFRGENNFSFIDGTIKEIMQNGVDCTVNTEFGEFYIGEWLIVEQHETIQP